MKKITYLVLFLMLADCAAAQNGIRITTLPSQYLYRDFNITVERKISNFTIGGTLAYRPAPGGEEYLLLDPTGTGFLITNYRLSPMVNRFQWGYTIGANAKYYFKRLKNTYIEFNPFYRHWGVDNEQITFYADDDLFVGFSGRRTEAMDIYGFKLLAGFSRKWQDGDELQFLMDCYIGLGWRYKAYLYETRDGYIYGYLADRLMDRYDDNPYIQETGNYSVPTVHLGIKFGIGWNDRSKVKREDTYWWRNE